MTAEYVAGGCGAGNTATFAEWWDEIKKSDPSRLGSALAAWRLGEERASSLRADLAALLDLVDELSDELTPQQFAVYSRGVDALGKKRLHG